jgi:hypothetical protein
MNKVIIECAELVDKYGLNKENIIKQLEMVEVKKDQDFIIAYDKDFRYTLIGEMCKNNSSIVLTNIEKAIAFEKMDNTDLYEFIKKGQGK